MKFALPLVLVAFAVSACGSPLARQTKGPSVTDSIHQITYIGNSSHGVESFLNIRFGQDTSGANRFKSPQQFSYPPNTVVNASAPGAACPQQKVPLKGFQVFDNVTNMSEDCLTLRIDRPAETASDAKLPVMIWIYGGGFSIGQIYDSAYTPTGLVAGSAAKKTPIIYVAMNYRVGLFGFASTAGMSPEDLNSGLLDQRLAMEWVQQNIALFGGDPDNVTIFGESAGANSVGLHLVSYAGNESMTPPFQRAIMQSGGTTGQLGMTSNTTANHTATVIESVNCTSSSGDHAAELSCLRSIPLSTLTSVSTDFSLTIEPFGGFNAFIPVISSTIIPSAPSELLVAGKFHRNISVISGWTEDDSSLFTPPTIRTEADLRSWLLASNLTDSVIDQLFTLYPDSSYSDDPTENVTSQFFRGSQMDRDREVVCPSLLINAAMTNASSATTTNYLFALNATLFGSFFAMANTTYLGVSHFSDIGYVFNQAAYHPYDASTANIMLANQISSSWASFATDGYPDNHSNSTISPWTQGATANVYDNFNVRILGGPRDGMESIGDNSSVSDLPSYNEDLIRRCQFWNSPELLQMSAT